MADAPADKQGFKCRLVWTGAASGRPFTYDTYSREHRIEIEGKVAVNASSAPSFIGDAKLHNPEDFLMSAVTSCHFLTYIALCAKSRVQVLAYEDNPEGFIEKVDGIFRFTRIVLHPKVTVVPGADAERAKSLHERAHHHCIIANSVNFPVTNEPVIVTG